VGNDPVILNQRQLLNYLFLLIIDEYGCAWPIDSNHCIHLIAQLAANQSILIGPPNGENATNGKISIND
jgi:hypothetical protein